jgi:multisubunit Na+/H+ antiporter MnhB subunit
MFLKLELQEKTTVSSELSSVARWLCGALVALLVGALTIAIIDPTIAGPDLAALVSASMPVSGVGNPVTGVLLNFRSFDTLLEIAVLLIVAVAMMPASTIPASLMSKNKTRFIVVNHHHLVHPVLVGLVRWLVPLAIVVSGYLLWTGAHAPGGAFQAGAVLASAGVALSLTGRHEFVWHGLAARFLLSVGLLVFVAVAVSNFMATGTVLQYPVNAAGALILVVEIAATLSIAAILLLLFTRLMQVSEAAEELNDMVDKASK